jgi:hypothetical protein
MTTYNLRTDRTVLPEPSLPAIGAAGSSYTDPIFGTKITRVTDQAFAQSIGAPKRSFSTGSGSEQLTWSSDSSAFIVQDLGGGVWIPFTATGSKIPTPDTYFLPLNGPAFSVTEPMVLFGRSRDDKSLCKYNLTTQQLTTVVDFPNTATGEVSPSANGRVATFGNGGQDVATEVYVWDGSKLRTLNTLTGKVDGSSLNSTEVKWGFGVHNVRINASGRFVIITTHELNSVIPSSPMCIWDLEQNSAWSLEPTFSGHKVSGWNQLINQDSAGGQWDDMQYVIRNLDRSGSLQNLINPVLSQRLTDPTHGQDSHLSWINDKGNNEPVLVSAYRGADITEPWRPWTNEIILIATDGSGTVWRVCHHRTVYTDFWDGPHGIISPDGTKVIFTSNMGQSLGVGEFGGFRQDVFMATLSGSFTPPPTTAIVSGKVLKNSGLPLSGALILLKTTGQKTYKAYTKADGSFSFTVPNNLGYALIPVASEYWVYTPCFKGIKLNGDSPANDFVATASNELVPR